jgi:hypothetical protein
MGLETTQASCPCRSTPIPISTTNNRISPSPMPIDCVRHSVGRTPLTFTLSHAFGRPYTSSGGGDQPPIFVLVSEPSQRSHTRVPVLSAFSASGPQLLNMFFGPTDEVP